MKLIRDKNIAIIGGGPGGLTLARLLQMNGADVNVYERDENQDVRVQGATLDLHDESGLRALREAGLMDEFKANYRPGADHLRITDKDANIIYEDNFETGTGNTLARPEIDRGPLRKILLDSLQPDTVVWNSNFASLTRQNNSFKIDFRNGTEAYADIVIAADGANSKIRPYLTPIKPFYAGVSVIEGSVYDSETNCPNVHKLLHGGKIFALGNGKTLIISSKGDGSVVFYFGFKSAENYLKESGLDFTDKFQILAWFNDEFSGWDEIWNELFENANPRFIARPQYCMPLDQQWDTQPNLTMLGDAAHLMPPFAGEGVNMAMLDALELAECWLSDDFTDAHEAMTAYETGMLRRASETAKMTLEQTELLHSEDAIANMLQLFGQV